MFNVSREVSFSAILEGGGGGLGRIAIRFLFLGDIELVERSLQVAIDQISWQQNAFFFIIIFVN